MKTIEELKEHFPNIEFSDKYLEILNYIRENENAKVSVQGQAGSGKSVLLKIINYMFSDDVKNHRINVAIASSTGVASALLNTNGDISATTIHSLFGLKAQDLFGTFHNGKNYYQAELISNIDCFIFDEISMVSSDLFDYIMQIIKYCRKGKPTKILLFGDALQLQCVVKTDDDKVKDYYDSTYNGNVEFFSSHAYKDMKFATFLLTKIYRQNSDEEGEKFKDILNRIRVCEQSQEDLDWLNQRVISEDDYIMQNESFLRIVSTNKDVQKYNQIALDSIDGKYVNFNAMIGGNFRESSEFKTGYYPETISVKIGCPIMITKNSKKDNNGNYEYYNGSMGILVDASENGDWADVDLGDKIVRVEKSLTNHFEYEIEHDGDKSIVTPHIRGYYENVMIKPCVSCTIHKTQGLTISNGYLDFGWWLPDNGIYVALSRFRSIQNFGLRKPLKMKDIHCSQESLNYVNNAEYTESVFNELFGDESDETNNNDSDEKAKKFFEKKSKFESFLKENNIVFKNGKWIDEESGLEIVK